MSLIVSEVYDALISAGASEEKAKAAAGVIPVVENLATKDDIGVLRQDLMVHKLATKDDIAVLRHDLAVLKLAVFSFAPAVLALLVKLVFFP